MTVFHLVSWICHPSGFIVSDIILTANLMEDALYVMSWFFSCYFQDLLFFFGFRPHKLGCIKMWLSLSLSHLKFVELLGYVNKCFSSNLGCLSNYFFQYFLCLCLSLIYFWSSNYAYVRAQVSETLCNFVFIFIFFVLKLDNLDLSSSLLIQNLPTQICC